MCTFVFRASGAEEDMPKTDVSEMEQLDDVQIKWFTRTGGETDNSETAAYGYITDLWSKDFVLEYTFHCTQASDPGIWRMYYGAEYDFDNDQNLTDKYNGRVGYYRQFWNEVSWIMTFFSSEYKGLNETYKVFGHPKTKFDKSDWIEKDKAYDVYLSCCNGNITFGMKESTNNKWYYYTDKLTSDKAGTVYISHAGIAGTYDNIVLYGERPVSASADRKEYAVYSGSNIGITFTKEIVSAPVEAVLKNDYSEFICEVKQDENDRKKFNLIPKDELKPSEEYSLSLNEFIADDNSACRTPITIRTNHGLLKKSDTENLKEIFEPNIEWFTDNDTDYGRFSSIWSDYYVLEYDVEFENIDSDSVHAVVFGNFDYDFTKVSDKSQYLFLLGISNDVIVGHKSNDDDYMQLRYADEYDGRIETGKKYHIYTAYIDNKIYFAYKPSDSEDNRYVWYSEEYDSNGKNGGLFIINSGNDMKISNITLYANDGYSSVLKKIEVLKQINTADDANTILAIVENEPFNCFDNDFFNSLNEEDKNLCKQGLAQIILDKKNELGGFETNSKITFADVEYFEECTRKATELLKLSVLDGDELIRLIENGKIEEIDISDSDYIENKRDIILMLKKMQASDKIGYFKREKDFADIFSKSKALVIINKAENREEAKNAINKYGEVLGLDLIEYKKQNELLVCSALIGKNFTTVSGVQKAIDNKIAEIKAGNDKKNSQKEGTTSRTTSGKTSDIPSVAAQSDNLTYQNNDNKEKNECKFNDLENVLWAKNEILALYDKNIILGVSDTSFEPQRNITRAEFVSILVRALNIKKTDSENKTLNDVLGGAWYSEAIASALSNGIVNGDENGNFNPDMPITRQDAAVMVFRTYKELKNNDKIKSFTDEESISEYAYESVKVLSARGIINGYSDGSFAPGNKLTRAETAVIVYRIINDLV